MRKIAIIKGHNIESNYSNWEVLIDKITDFAEVDEDTYVMLKTASYNMGFTIVEQVINQEEFIAKTVLEYKVLVEKQKAQEAKLKAQELKIKQERALKRKAKTEAEEKRLLIQLTLKHGHLPKD